MFPMDVTEFQNLTKGFLFFAEDQDPKSIAAKPDKIPSQMDNFLQEIFSMVIHRHKSLLAFIFRPMYSDQRFHSAERL